MRHYITYFSLIAFHFSLTGCHTQQSSVMTAGTGVDSVKVHEEMVTIHLSDSLLQECIFQADSLSITSSPAAWSPTESGALAFGRLSATAEMQCGVRLEAKGVKVTARKSQVKEEIARVCIEDTSSVHIRDSTAVRNQEDRRAIYEPPDIQAILIVFGLFFISYLIFSRR